MSCFSREQIEFFVNQDKERLIEEASGRGIKYSPEKEASLSVVTNPICMNQAKQHFKTSYLSCVSELLNKMVETRYDLVEISVGRDPSDIYGDTMTLIARMG